MSYDNNIINNIINNIRVLIKLDIMKIISYEEKNKIELLIPEIKKQRMNNMKIFEDNSINQLPIEIILNIKKYVL